jgi:hypothetical protein
MRDPMAKRGLGTIAAAVVVSLAAQRAALDGHGPVAATRGPHDRDEGMRRFDGGTRRGDDRHGCVPNAKSSITAAPIGEIGEIGGSPFRFSAGVLNASSTDTAKGAHA